MFGELGVQASDLLVSQGGGLGGNLLGLVLEVLVGLCLSLLFHGGDEVLLGPSDVAGEFSEFAEVSVCLQSEDLEGLGHDHSLSLVIWVRNSLEDLEVLESSLSSGFFVGSHTSEGSPEHSGGRSEMLEVSSGVSVVGLPQELVVVKLISEQRTGQAEALASDNDDLLASEQLVSDNGGESAYQVSSSVYDNLLFEHT